MTKRRAYRFAWIAAGLLAAYLMSQWLTGDFLRSSDCPEFTEAEAAIAEAFTLVRGGDRGEWPGGLVLNVVDVLDQDQCGSRLALLQGGWIRVGSQIEISGAISDTIGVDIIRDGPLSNPYSSPNPTISWYTGFGESGRMSWTSASGDEEIDPNRLAPFLEGGVLEISMWMADSSELGLYVVKDSGVVAVRHDDRFWGDRGVRNRVFLTVAGWYPAW